MKVFDVTVPLDASLPTYPGNTPFTLEPVKRMATGGSSNVSTLHLSAHSGTHVDAPRHFFDDRPGTESLPLDVLMGPARVIELEAAHGIDAAELGAFDLSGDVRVLFKTPNSRLWGTSTFAPGYVGVTDTGARHLVEHGIKLVGVDYLSVEAFKTPGAPAHHVRLGAGTIVVEGLNLCGVPPGLYDLICLPLNIVDADGAPARVVLRQG